MRSLINAVGLIALVAATFLPSSGNTRSNSESPLQNNTILYAGSEYYPPFEWLDDNGDAHGFITDLQRAMAATDNTNIEFQLSSWRAALDAVIEGEADAVALIPSDDRRDFFSFTQPIHYLSHGIFSHTNGSQYTQLSQLAGQTVAVAEGAFAANKLRSLNLDLTMLIAADELDCLSKVANKAADACIEVNITSDQLINRYDLPVTSAGIQFWPQPYAFGVKKGNDELLNHLNNKLATIIVNGQYEAIYKRWEHLLEPRAHGVWNAILNALWFIIPLTLLAFIGLYWSVTLRYKVREKTAALRIELQQNKALQQQIEFNAAHDNITGLYTRTAFFRELDKQLEPDANDHAHAVTLVTIQITNIESMITVFGYETAFNTVAKFGERLKAMRQYTSAHFGSGLFGLTLRDESKMGNVIDALREPLFSKAGEIEPQLAFGIAQSHCAVENIDGAELVRRAITALTAAQKRKIQYCIYSDADEPDVQNLQLLNDFHKFGCQQFVLYFQPQLDIARQNISHAEALIRWQHPSLGLVPPNKFIPLLEESGGIKQLTCWVIQQAVNKIQRAARSDPQNPLKLSVNISSHDLLDEAFLAFVRSAITDINPSQLLFEITESGLIEESSHAKEVIYSLASMGIGCAVDDFGTGYSSLYYLNELSVQEIKLDQVFVQALCNSRRSLTIVKSTINLAHDLGLKTVAEGVEDKQTLDKLTELGCDRIQGFYIAKPMQENELDAFLKKA
ncbi:EAL domain-containing protein [Idiomarina seosinensis]|uniref:Diguanylate cyclase n=1 Tax=Idiomarina seosinensis TaxID=281739 RepID=A0A432ZIK5_9GAMM|nr:EAL domain-containing protein [Idiomarina seosinensis]RUO77855.1 diguanylate cyclase [Idiomarina seosinensis]